MNEAPLSATPPPSIAPAPIAPPPSDTISILAHTFFLYRMNFSLIALLYLLPMPLILVSSLLFYPAFAQHHPYPHLLSALVIGIIFNPLLHVASTYACYRYQLTGIPVTPATALRHAFSLWGKAFSVELSAGIRLLGGFLALLVPGLILMIRYALIIPVLVVEGKQQDILARSRKLTLGRWWSIACPILVYAIGVAILNNSLMKLCHNAWADTALKYIVYLLGAFSSVLILSIYLSLDHPASTPSFSAVLPPPYAVPPAENETEAAPPATSEE